MRRVDVAVGAFVVVILGSALGVLMFGAQAAPAPVSSSTTPTPSMSGPMRAAQTQIAIPTPGAIGSYGWMSPSGGGYNYRLVWVNRTGLWAWNRAYEERDNKGMSDIIRLYETLQVTDGTRVQVVAKDGETIQIEILEGTLSGRRGWMDFSPGMIVGVDPRPTVPPAASLAVNGAARLWSKWNHPWRIAPDRTAYDAWRKNYRSDVDADAATTATTLTATWVTVERGQAVTIAQIDGDAVEVILNGGPGHGARGWVARSNLVQ